MLNSRYKKLLSQSALYGLSIVLMKGISLIIATNTLRTALFYYFSQKKDYLPYRFGYLFSAISAAFIASWFGQAA